MKTPPELSEFVVQALRTGRSRIEVKSALEEAGWEATEIDEALSLWSDLRVNSEPVPRPVRSTASKDALFYLLHFITLGMIVSSALALIYGQTKVWFPDGDRLSSYDITGLRWSMAVLIVYLPAFWLLNRHDERKCRKDNARRHSGLRRWLASFAILISVVALMGDALFVIYAYLDGEVTAQFLAKAGAVAVMSLSVLFYFSLGFNALTEDTRQWPHRLLITIVGLSLVATFLTIGGPAQGRSETNDRSRLKDLNSLADDMMDCSLLDHENLPENFDPKTCSKSPYKLSKFADEVTYNRVDNSRYEICVTIDNPGVVSIWGDMALNGDIVCRSHEG